MFGVGSGGGYVKQKDVKSLVVDGVTWLRDYITAIKHGRLHPFTPQERKAREATRNEPWGPTGTLLNELAELSQDLQSCQVIFAVLEYRLTRPPEKWINVYKALQVVEYLLKKGSGMCVDLARDELLPYIENLHSFEYTLTNGRDCGLNVRVRSKAVAALLLDAEGLHLERKRLADRARQEYLSTTSAAPQELPPDDPRLAFDSSAATARRAGEMKGVTLVENEQRLAALRLLLAREDNRWCADCQGHEVASRPSWASINTGVFVCLRCAGLHRSLGTHISQVRSCTLDTWRPEQVDFMASTGNRLANQYWEAAMPAGVRPTYDDGGMEAFIRKKYRGDWARGSWPPPVLPFHTIPDTAPTRSPSPEPPMSPPLDFPGSDPTSFSAYPPAPAWDNLPPPQHTGGSLAPMTRATAALFNPNTHRISPALAGGGSSTAGTPRSNGTPPSPTSAGRDQGPLEWHPPHHPPHHLLNHPPLRHAPEAGLR